jgi:ferredoxin-type protein NapG
MKDFLLPVVTEKCVGCGICVEKCPTEPKKSINVIPKGMEDITGAGYYYRKSRVIEEKSKYKKEILKGDELIDKKQGISTFGNKPTFKNNFEVQDNLEDWE